MRLKSLLIEGRLDELTAVERWTVFGDKNEMLCVDARHFEFYGDCGELQEDAYTWYVPYSFDGKAVQPGDLLAVETTVGHGVQLVVAVCTPYVRPLSGLIEEGHPYCGIISNLGDTSLADGRRTHELDLVNVM
ncbi:hypothetical protein [Porphyromonas gulae]|uniref:hypothetical protein n=1 Tax=Porphyromonas gulae TaxID=111105 RepID=UPI00052D39E1|nr:hypothetical protein [Porphyromonas gulae]KGN87680.1 hypothetical protein HQ46_08680 [Porphyromonas gulae]